MAETQSDIKSESTHPSIPSWEQWHELGVVRAFRSTLEQLLPQPVETVQALPKDGGVIVPLAFAILAALVAKFLLAFGIFLRAAVFRGSFADIENYIRFASTLVFAPLLQILYVSALAALTWLMLKMVHKKQIHLRYVFRVQCYVLGVAIFCDYAFVVVGLVLRWNGFRDGFLLSWIPIFATLLCWFWTTEAFIGRRLSALAAQAPTAICFLAIFCYPFSRRSDFSGLDLLITTNIERIIGSLF